MDPNVQPQAKRTVHNRFVNKYIQVSTKHEPTMNKLRHKKSTQYKLETCMYFLL